jgi:hypothetical protein
MIDLSAAIISQTPRVPKKLAGMILLGGWVRPKELSKVAGRSLLDLPIDAEHSLLAHWLTEAGALCRVGKIDFLPVRILLDQHSPKPTLPVVPEGIALSLEHDPSEFRGTAGVLHDACAKYHDDDLILVANAAQILFCPLYRLLSCLDTLDAGVAMAAHADGTPVTLMLLRCACLRDIPPVGYCDLKEQALPLIAQRYPIKAATFSHLICRGIRTRDSYVQALRALHGRSAADPLAENWRSDFQICESGATVGRGARLHNSVVLRGAVIGRDAVLVRSVAFPGAVVPPGALLVDKLISADGIWNSEEVSA